MELEYIAYYRIQVKQESRGFRLLFLGIKI
jgi:hypothetical protein